MGDFRRYDRARRAQYYRARRFRDDVQGGHNVRTANRARTEAGPENDLEASGPARDCERSAPGNLEMSPVQRTTGQMQLPLPVVRTTRT